MSTDTSDPRPADPTVRLERDERGVATLVVDAPPVNLYTLDLHARIDACLDDVEASPPRVLVVRAAGRVVSGGVDVAQFHARTSREQTQELYDRMMRLPERIAALEMPTVFAAHALTLTWAFEVALACDLIVAAEEARFGLVERVIGLTPTMGGTQRLAQRAGVARAKELVFTGALFEAAVLERWNVVNRVLPRAELDAGLDALVADLAVGPTRAFATAKQILRELEADGLAHANARTTTLASALFETDDLRHGMASFLEHGPGHARFEGR